MDHHPFKWIEEKFRTGFFFPSHHPCHGPQNFPLASILPCHLSSNLHRLSFPIDGTTHLYGTRDYFCIICGSMLGSIVGGGWWRAYTSWNSRIQSWCWCSLARVDWQWRSKENWLRKLHSVGICTSLHLPGSIADCACMKIESSVEGWQRRINSWEG